MYYWIIHYLTTFSTEQNRQKDGLMIATFVLDTLSGSKAIEIYTPYDVTSSGPRKTTIAVFVILGGTEKLFCAPDQTLNSKIMN